jgi:hypothetical protein
VLGRIPVAGAAQAADDTDSTDLRGFDAVSSDMPVAGHWRSNEKVSRALRGRF